MIQDGQLNATISQPPTNTNTTTNGNSTPSPILRFHSSATSGPTSSATTDTATKIQTQIQLIENLSAQVKEADRKLAVTKEYADWIRRTKKLDAGTNAFEDPMEMNWEPPNIGNLQPGGNLFGGGEGDDEDIMAG